MSTAALMIFYLYIFLQENMTGLWSLTVNTASRRAHVPWFVYSLTEAKHLATVPVSHGPRLACSHRPLPAPVAVSFLTSLSWELWVSTTSDSPLKQHKQIPPSQHQHYLGSWRLDLDLDCNPSRSVLPLSFPSNTSDAHERKPPTQRALA